MITQIVFVDAEKPPEYLPRFLAAAAGVHVIVISQEADPSCTMEIAGQYGAQFVNAAQPQVGGTCIWDVLDTLKRVWPRIKSEYVTFAHPEFLWLPEMVENTKRWLTENKSTVALGNLRRIGAEDQGAYRGNPEDTVEALRMLDSGGDISSVVTKSWAYWKHEPVAYEQGWVEDVFFARKSFLDLVRFPYHGSPQPFQDVYDLLDVVIHILGRFEVNVDVVRMPRSANEMWHLYHDRPRSWIRPEVKAWFHNNKDRYEETLFLRDDLWDRLMNELTWTVMSDVRRGPKGTCTRYQSEFGEWLHSGNLDRVAEYLGSEHGKED